MLKIWFIILKGRANTLAEALKNSKSFLDRSSKADVHFGVKTTDIYILAYCNLNEGLKLGTFSPTHRRPRTLSPDATTGQKISAAKCGKTFVLLSSYRNFPNISRTLIVFTGQNIFLGFLIFYAVLKNNNWLYSVLWVYKKRRCTKRTEVYKRFFQQRCTNGGVQTEVYKHRCTNRGVQTDVYKKQTRG